MCSVPVPAVLIDIADETLADRVARARFIGPSGTIVTRSRCPPESRFDLVVSTRREVLAELGLALAARPTWG